MLTILSLGAGVQSSTLALMAAHGEITPAPDAAIFADTQAEPQAVYDWLDQLTALLPFPVHRVTAGNLTQKIQNMIGGTGRGNARPPFFVEGGGMLRRQCTQDYKLIPIEREVRRLLGLKKRQRWPKEPVVEQWIGISTDEASRMKPSRRAAVTNRWPLIEREMTRHDCLRWLAARGYPSPPKSACTFCPFHNDALWADMKANDPVAFAEAVAVDRAIRPGWRPGRSPSRWYLHRSLQPLEEVGFDRTNKRQINLFENECTGMCGV